MKKIIFDKNYIQGNKKVNLEKNFGESSNYLPINIDQLKIECIAELLQKIKKKSNPEDDTKSLFSKLALFPTAKYNHMDFVRKELCDGVEIKQKHDFFGYVSINNKKRNNQTIDLYTDAVLHDEQIKLWSKGKFDETVEGSSGREIAKLYREQIRGSDGIIRKDLKDSDAPLDPEELICQVKSIVKSINFNEPSNDNTSMFLTWLESKDVIKDDIVGIKKFLQDRSQSQFLHQFAPYTAYVYTMRTLFDHILRNEKTKIHKKNIQKIMKKTLIGWT